MISDPPEVIVHEATNNTDDIVYTLQQVEKIEASFQFQSSNIFCEHAKFLSRMKILDQKFWFFKDTEIVAEIESQ